MLAVFKKPRGGGVKQEHGSEDEGMKAGGDHLDAEWLIM